jgi:transcriptional regulator with XRE-family HTH domain
MGSIIDLTSEDVRNLRERLGMTKAAFARLLNVELRTVTRWEGSGPRPAGSGEALLCALREALVPAHNGGRSEISDVYIRAACRFFNIDEKELRKKL